MSDAELELEIKDQNEITGEVEERVYELGYLLVPTIAEEQVPASYGNLKDMINSFGGVVIADEMPKMMALAYQMQRVVTNVRSKFSNAYFGWIKFTMSPEEVLELKKKLDLSPELIRFLILKTVKENTIAAKRFVGRDMPYRRIGTMHKPPEAGEAVPINKEEIDKEIDAMVAA